MIKLRLRGEEEELKEMLKHISFDEDVEVLRMSDPYPDSLNKNSVRIYCYVKLKSDEE